MKKIYSLVLALVSTCFLAVGAARAAATFDTLAGSSSVSSVSGALMDDPPMPCYIIEKSVTPRVTSSVAN